MVSEPTNAQKSPYITRLANCLNQKLPTDFADEANLRRLITAQMPSFFIFIEFDGKSTAQRAFLVHIDEELITRTLKRLHEIDQSKNANNLNKRTMTVYYGKENELKSLSGKSLKSALEKNIGKNIADYISKKRAFLELTGYEDGFAQVTFTTEGEDSFEDLIDASLGLNKEIDLKSFKSVSKRFGIEGQTPIVDVTEGVMTIPNVEPITKGKLYFKEDKLSSGLCFSTKLYSSPFNQMLPDKEKRMRLEGDFFDIIFYPMTGKANYSFSFGEGISLDLEKFKNALKLISLLDSSGKELIIEMQLETLPNNQLTISCKNNEDSFASEISTLESAIRIKHIFDISETVEVSIHDIKKHSKQIKQFEDIFTTAKHFKFKFDIIGSDFDCSKKAACVITLSCPLGSHTVGAIIALTGEVEPIENGRYQLITTNIEVEKKIVTKADKALDQNDLTEAIMKIEKRYENQYSVISSVEREH